MDRLTRTSVAWLTLAQPTAGVAGVTGAAAVSAVATCVPHPATAALSSPATTIPRTWRRCVRYIMPF
jgi:hypothetical protein